MKFAEGARVRVGDLEIEPETRRVWRAGKPLALQDKSFELLRYLIERHPETARHAELMQNVWKGLVVSQDTVAQRVKLLRKALGDTGTDARYLVSVHGEGYRLAVAPREAAVPEDAPTGQSRPVPRWLAVAAVVLLLMVLVLSRQGGLVHGIKHLFKHGL